VESPITLKSDNETELNRQIDDKLKQGYLLKGGIQKIDDNSYTQEMVVANNLDGELTLKGAIKLAIFVPLYILIVYYFI
jgi:hypothetical protein